MRPSSIDFSTVSPFSIHLSGRLSSPLLLRPFSTSPLFSTSQRSLLLRPFSTSLTVSLHPLDLLILLILFEIRDGFCNLRLGFFF
ncbi:hypothetical protein Bca4012_092969 [Brassica carinata]|uniref:Uncharacterized protein n=2 Tax=Brassica oleracea TaxID=3712 RepID=A0A0D3DL90_BRAOL|nr:unnamed protein product [Brassica oleracea]